MGSGHDRLPCTFQLLRYVPDAVRNEYVHIGVVLRTAEPGGDSEILSGTRAGSEPGVEPGGGPGNEQGETQVRLTRDWRRVRCLDPDADTAMLEGMELELRQRLSEGPEGKLRKILDESLSLNLQMTEPKAYLAESLAAGMEELMRLYVEPAPREKQARLRGRAAIQAALRREFERAQVWDLMRKQIRASQYTRPGDPLRIDAGYRRNGVSHSTNLDLSVGTPVIRMFQAVSLEPGVEMAKVLAFSAAGLKAGVERMEKAELELTAIVEPAARIGATDEEPERLEQYRFAVETMEEHAIRVLTTERLPLVAETARRELRVG